MGRHFFILVFRKGQNWPRGTMQHNIYIEISEAIPADSFRLLLFYFYVCIHIYIFVSCFRRAKMTAFQISIRPGALYRRRMEKVSDIAMTNA